MQSKGVFDTVVQACFIAPQISCVFLNRYNIMISVYQKSIYFYLRTTLC